MSTKFAENTNELLLELWDARGRANYVSLEDKQRRHLDEAMEMEPTFHKHFHFLEFGGMLESPFALLWSPEKGRKGIGLTGKSAYSFRKSDHVGVQRRGKLRREGREIFLAGILSLSAQILLFCLPSFLFR